MARTPETTAPAIDKRAKFIELAERRVAKAIAASNIVGNLANRKQYDFTEADVIVIEKALNDTVGAVIERFRAALEGKTTKAPSTFKLGE